VAIRKKLTAKLKLMFEPIGGRKGISSLQTRLRGFGRLARVDWLLFSSPFFPAGAGVVDEGCGL
jgi:hypothetical protein